MTTEKASLPSVTDGELERLMELFEGSVIARGILRKGFHEGEKWVDIRYENGRMASHPIGDALIEADELSRAARAALVSYVTQKSEGPRRVWVYCPNCKTGFINTIDAAIQEGSND